MLRRILPYVIWAFYRVWTLTWRIVEVQPPQLTGGKPAAGQLSIVAHWHGDELTLLGMHRRYRIAAMVSTSRDGDLMARCLALLGIKTSRGSSTRGGATALMGLCRLAREGWLPVVAVDGPRGPYHQAKPGVFALSGMLGAEILPIGVACSRAIVFAKSWNKAYLPLPFSRIQVVWGQPRPAVSRQDDPHLHELSAELEKSLEAAGRAAAEQLAARGGSPRGAPIAACPPRAVETRVSPTPHEHSSDGDH